MIALLAHQGGWDEILLVLGPIVLIAGLLMLVKNRVARGPVKPPDGNGNGNGHGNGNGDHA